MNILDQNIIASQRQRLRSWRIAVRQIGVDLARKGFQDEEILPFLHHENGVLTALHTTGERVEDSPWIIKH